MRCKCDAKKQKQKNKKQTDECWENAGTPECWTTETALGKRRVETVATGIVDAREFEENADRYAAHFVFVSISWQFPPALSTLNPHIPHYIIPHRVPIQHKLVLLLVGLGMGIVFVLLLLLRDW
jgi:hypothetical protein